ncbi:hypothetical protein N9904_03415, partial [Akkermansiaceae bacterium]|nr:hypothetical protein [Akkermansiaceae bacterium]
PWFRGSSERLGGQLKIFQNLAYDGSKGASEVITFTPCYETRDSPLPKTQKSIECDRIKTRD